MRSKSEDKQKTKKLEATLHQQAIKSKDRITGGIAMKLEVGKKYRTVCGMIVTVKAEYSECNSNYAFVVEGESLRSVFTEDGFYYQSKSPCCYNIIEEIKENTMFNKNYKYLCMDADGYNKAAFNRPTINTDMSCWVGYEDILQVGLFNLGDDWKESLREIVYNDDGSIYLRKPRCFADGTTSFSGVHVNIWDEIKPYVEEGE